MLELAPLILVMALLAAVAWAGRRGRGVGGDVIVRCLAGHLFTTAWIPGLSAKAIHLGWFRLQWCPAGEHWTLVTPVRGSGLTDEERWLAGQYRDGPVP
jgi:hypothetical protein